MCMPDHNQAGCAASSTVGNTTTADQYGVERRFTQATMLRSSGPGPYLTGVVRGGRLIGFHCNLLSPQ